MSHPIATAFLSFLVWSCSLPPSILLGGDAHPEQQLRELEERWLASGDNPEVLQSILADDFIHVLPFGFVTKSEQIHYLRSHPPAEHAGAKHFQDVRIRVFGNVAIVNGIVEATEADGGTRKTIFTDVFAYRESRWQAVNAQESPFNDSAQR